MQHYHDPRRGRFRPPQRPWASLWRTFLTGMVAVIPLAVTAYVLTAHMHGAPGDCNSDG
jgi:hypothetical protein